MKLIVAVVDDKDANRVMSALTDQHVGVTCVSSTGSFIIPGKSTLLTGVDDALVPQVMTVIAELAATRQSYVPMARGADPYLASMVEVPTGGFLSFVLEVDHFEQV